MPLDLPVPTVRRGDLPGPCGVVGERDDGPAPAGVRAVRPWASLRVFDLALACCAVEYLAAATEARFVEHGRAPRTGFEVLGAAPFAPAPALADVLVVSGTVTEALAPAVRAAYEALREPRYVVSFGACSDTGGPFWDSYSVVAGVDRIVPVDLYVPGCPPRPEALLDALALLQGRVGEGAAP